jgi:hypothetical protein
MNKQISNVENLNILDLDDLDVFNELKLELTMLKVVRQKNCGLFLELMGYSDIFNLYFFNEVYKLHLPKCYYLYIFNNKLEHIKTFQFIKLKDTIVLDYCKKLQIEKISNNIFYFYISDKNNLYKV